MRWFVFIEGYGCVFECDDNSEGEQKVVDFLVDVMEDRYDTSPEETDSYYVIRGEAKTFVPPSSKGGLV